jgi:hypothetical protein
MKVFISWSGDTSKNIAEIFRQWLPSVIQSVKPYYSPDDIAKGTRWSSEIAKELDESKVGIICLTRENLVSPWIMFEAGALSKNIDKSKVCPMLFGIDPSDIQGPLVQFQAAKFSKEEVRKVVRMINNELGDNALASEVFEGVFEMWWPKLKEEVEAELSKVRKVNEKEVRSERELLEEILSLTRNISLVRDKTAELGYLEYKNIVDEVNMSLDGMAVSIIDEDMAVCSESFLRIVRQIRLLVENVSYPKVYKQKAISYLQSLESFMMRYNHTGHRVPRKRKAAKKAEESSSEQG